MLVAVCNRRSAQQDDFEGGINNEFNENESEVKIQKYWNPTEIGTKHYYKRNVL